MTENKFWAFLGIALAVVAFFQNMFSSTILVLLGVGVVILCFLISKTWNKVERANLKWIDALFFPFSKNDFNYTIVDKIVKYTIESENDAKYEVKCKLKNNKNSDDFYYRGRYHWEQDTPIQVEVPRNFSYNCSEDLKWSEVRIEPIDRIVHKNDIIDCGFLLQNLHISNLNKHSYLSCKVIEKIKHLQMIAQVSDSLNPEPEAHFIIQDSFGREILRERVFYDEKTNSYKKTISYPRRGRKYIIKWYYKQ